MLEELAATGLAARPVVSLMEAAAKSTLEKPAGFATTSLLPKNLASNSRSMAQPCCTRAGTDTIKSLHQKLTEQKKAYKVATRSGSLRNATYTLFCGQPGHTLRVSLSRLLQKKMPSSRKRACVAGLYAEYNTHQNRA